MCGNKKRVKGNMVEFGFIKGSNFLLASNICRLPTHSNLSRRRVLVDGVSLDCVWCPRIWEVDDHLFCRCNFVVEIWYSIFKWIRTEVTLLGNVVSLLDNFSSLIKKHRKSLTLIWHATSWKIFYIMNDTQTFFFV